MNVSRRREDGPSLIRSYSNLKLPSNISNQQKYDVDIVTLKKRRKISADENKGTIKNNNYLSDKEDEKWQIANNFGYRFSTELLSQEMEYQKNKQLNTILSSPQLSTYYYCLKKLFMILFQASAIIEDNAFRLSNQLLKNHHLQIVQILLDEKIDYNIWNEAYFKKLQFLAKNIFSLSSKCTEYQTRVELVTIKVCMHNEKRMKIQNAFLNTKIEKYWKNIQQKYRDSDIFYFIEDQFERAEQKLCLIQFQQFVKTKLCTKSFGKVINKFCPFEEIDHDMNFNYKFQFLLTSELCFTSIEQLQIEQVKQEGEKGVCQIM